MLINYILQPCEDIISTYTRHAEMKDLSPINLLAVNILFEDPFGLSHLFPLICEDIAFWQFVWSTVALSEWTGLSEHACEGSWDFYSMRGLAPLPPFFFSSSSASAESAPPKPKTWLRTRGCGGRCSARSPRSLSWCGTLGKTRAAETEKRNFPLHFIGKNNT